MDRKKMLAYLIRVASPVLEAAAQDRLKQTMAVEAAPATAEDKRERLELDRRQFSAFEAVGRLLSGIAPWLDADVREQEERALQQRFAALAVQAIDNQTNPQAADYGRFEEFNYPCCQIVVDMAYLAQALIRAPESLLQKLSPQVRKQVLDAFLLSREIRPGYNNWLLFAAVTECGIYALTGKCDVMRVDCAVRQFEQWYVGDGMYSDGPVFAADYYNSFVIQPMLLDIARVLPHVVNTVQRAAIVRRAQRFCQIQERMICPDGSFIAIGRSMAYRGGCLQLLAQMAQLRLLPETLKPAQVRCALGAVTERVLAPASFRSDGFLQLGLCGYQPSLAEFYVSTGSLYMTSQIFQPLGLPENDPFWMEPDEKWTQKKIWDGEDSIADHKIWD